MEVILVKRKPLYAVIIYFDQLAGKMKTEMSKQNYQNFLLNESRINPLNKFKDSVSHALCSGVVHKIKLRQMCVRILLFDHAHIVYQLSEQKRLSE